VRSALRSSASRSLLRDIRHTIGFGLFALFLLTTIFPATAQHSPIAPIVQRTPDASTQLEQGRTLYEAGRFTEAATLWQQAAEGYQSQGERVKVALSLSYLSLAYQELGQWFDAQKAISQSLELLTDNKQQTTNHKLILAQALNTQGSLQLAMGQTEAALNTWKQAAIAYTDAGDEAGMLGSQINQAQALQTLGLYRQAQTTLEQLNEKLQAQPDSLVKATGLRSLGVALQVVGDLQKSQEVLEQSLAIAQRLESSPDTSTIFFSLGNTARALKDYQKAFDLYHKAAENATNRITKLEAQLNQLSLSVQTKKWEATQALLSQIQSNLTNLPPSRAAVYAQVNLAESLMARRSNSPDQPSEIAQLLAKAIQQARSLKDSRAESYALGELGRLYEQTQQWSDAQNLTQEALSLAQAINADHIAYRWEWQLGRILKQQGNLTGAVAAYTEAVNTLQSLRSDLVAINSDVQFTFRESVELVYRELVRLLLELPPTASLNLRPDQEGEQEGVLNQKNLEKARKVIESLQLAELDNFFREACLKTKPEQIDQVDPTAAVIYPIILPDRLAVIVSLPRQSSLKVRLSYYQTKLPQSQVESILEQLLQSLNPAFSNKQRLQVSQQVYDWLIRPAEVQLAESGVKTLVFVPDGSLRNLPMAALHDGQHYLVEKYSIAVSQGLQLLQPRSLIRKRLKVLLGGLTEARQGFSALPAVQSELNQIASKLRSKVLLNQKFIKTTLEDQIYAEPFPIIHLATHAQFSSNAENTFLLTWDGRINVKDLDRLLRGREREDTNPIELLVLSACQTAVGDKRAALGLAGLAVRSGTRSTLATLWSVRDQSTAELMAEFYRELTQTEVNKAEALRQAQLTLLKKPKYEHPFYWAPFVLVGNWL
jgi:CHAT domain-containing protein